MRKSCFIVLLSMFSVCVFSQQFERKNPLMPHGMKHPLIAVLDNPEFTPEERKNLKELAEKDPAEFSRKMKERYLLRKKKEAEKILMLRKKVLEAETPEAKKAAMEELKKHLTERSEQKLAFHRRILDETEKNIRQMQNRCEKLRKVYEERMKTKENRIEEELRQILSDTPPKHYQKNAAYTPEKK